MIDMFNNEYVDLGFILSGRQLELEDYYPILNFLDRVCNDSRFTLDFLYRDISKRVRDFFKEKFPNSKFYKFDVPIDTFNFNCVLTINPHNKFTGSERTPIIYKDYRTEGVTFDFQALLSHAVYRNSDLVLVDDSNSKKIIQQRYPNKNVIVGNPAFDYIFNEIETSVSKLDKYNILWVPYYDITTIGYSVFNKYAEFFRNELMLRYPEIVLHIEEDPRLRLNYEKLYHSSIDKYYSRFMLKNRIIIHKEPYHLIDYKNIDILVSDNPYLIKEWLPTNKPMIILNKGTEGLYTRYGQYLIDHSYYQAHSTKELMTWLDRLLWTGSGDYKNLMRESLTRDLFNNRNAPNSSYLIDTICSLYGTKS